MNPGELLFAETHEWVHLAANDNDTIATVGISAFAVEALTDLVYIELPDPGQAVSRKARACRLRRRRSPSGRGSRWAWR